MASLFGDSKLLKKDGSVVGASDALAGKEHVLLYFSAHWCGPCRGFTPQLIQFYNTASAARNFEVVFVTGDHSEAEFKEYYAEMPWLALAFDDSRKDQLSEQFQVTGIPALLVFRADGSLVTKKGTQGLRQNPDGFPWAPAFPLDTPISTVLEAAGSLVDNTGATFPVSSIRGSPRWGLYFSASWCGPCHVFMPKLRKFYEAVKAAHKDFEIVYVTWDRDEPSWAGFFKEHPWKALPFTDPKFAGIREYLDEKLQVRGIPTLVLLDENFQVVTSNGTALAEADPTGARYPWPAAPWITIIEAASELDSKPWLVGFADAIDEDKAPHLPASVQNLLAAVSQPFFVDNKPSPKIGFAYAGHVPISNRVRSAFGLDIIKSFPNTSEQAALFSIIDIRKGSKAVWPQASGLPSASALSQWVQEFLEGKAAVVGLDDNIDPEVIERKRQEMEAFNSWPATAKIPQHPHDLEKRPTVYRGSYGCDVCKKQGRGPAYHCDPCGFDAHPFCAGIVGAPAP